MRPLDHDTFHSIEIDALYDQYLTPAEQAVRMRGRSR